MQPPDVLVAFWRRFEGGDLFESETILLPMIRDKALLTPMNGDNIETVTAFQRTARPNLQGAVFHTGSWTSTFVTGNVFLVFSESDELIGSFSDLDSWYAAVPRKEFAQRYGLTQVGPWHGPISSGQFANPAKSGLRQCQLWPSRIRLKAELVVDGRYKPLPRSEIAFRGFY